MNVSRSWTTTVLTALVAGASVLGCADAWDEPAEESSAATLTNDDTWRCQTADARACTDEDLADPAKRHVVVVSAGFTERERADFWSEVDRVREALVGQGAGDVWSRQKKDQVLVLGWFSGGAALAPPGEGRDGVTFGARLARNPVRGFSLAVDPDKVKAFVDGELSRRVPKARPMAVGVVINSMEPGVTATAIMGGLLQRSWGIGTMTREHLRSRASYIATHELAHAGLNFADEYVEDGFESLDIKQLDVVTPLALLDASWGGLRDALGAVTGNYSWRTSEILAHNGFHNVATESAPSTVSTRGFAPERYPLEGGFFFGKGTWRPPGKNLMNDNADPQSPEDGFAFAHSPVQQRVVDARFGAGPQRPNDFLRAAGPHKSIAATGGATAMMFDGHKTSLAQPTVAYEVQIGWNERTVELCDRGLFSVPCIKERWRTATKRVVPDQRTVDVTASLGYGSVRLLHKVACKLGLEATLGGVEICANDFDETAGTFFSPAKIPVPYQTVSIPHVGGILNPLGKAKWRFRTDNGKHVSGWTGWSELVD